MRCLFSYYDTFFPYSATKKKIVEFTNCVDPDEVAHDEPPHLGLHCSPSSHWIFSIEKRVQTYFKI